MDQHSHDDAVSKRPLAPSATEDALTFLVRDFEHYLRQERGLAEATIHNYLSVWRTSLVTHFGKGMADPQQLCPADIIGFVRRIA